MTGKVAHDAAALTLTHHNAAEIIRRRQQGYGRGIVQLAHKGNRIVAAGRHVYVSKKWRFFTDFLVEFLRHNLGNLPPDHPVVRWYTRLIAATRGGEEGKPVSTSFGGYAASFFYLAYALYLIQHHDHLPASLLKRLRDPKLALPAAYEAFVGAAFAIAGFSLASDEVRVTNEPKGEFKVTAKSSGRVYSIEAKRKERWQFPYAGRVTPDFADELRRYVRSRLGKAARKKLPNPVYWLELSIADLHSEEDFLLIRKEIQVALRDAEQSMKIGGHSPEPAYIFVTNHGHLANDELTETGIFGTLEVFRISDFPDEGPMELEEAMKRLDTHRDIITVIRRLSEVRRVPLSFDAVPEQFVSRDGTYHSPPTLGDRIAITQPNGEIINGVLQEITATGDTAWVVLRDERGRNVMGQISLTPREASAALDYGDAIFGKDSGGTVLPPGDYLALYDWFLDTYKTYSREALLRQAQGHPRVAEFEQLETAELRTRVARELTKSAANRRPRAQTST